MSIHEWCLHWCAQNDIQKSIVGKDRPWRANVFVERLWRSVSCDEAGLKFYESTHLAKPRFGRWVNCYNRERKLQTLKTTLDQKYGMVEERKKSSMKCVKFRSG
jgi:hypothetical protein